VYFDGSAVLERFPLVDGVPVAVPDLSFGAFALYDPIAVAANGDVYGFPTNAPGTVAVFGAGSTVPKRTLTLQPSCASPATLALDRAGDLYVGCGAYPSSGRWHRSDAHETASIFGIVVYSSGAAGNATPTATISFESNLLPSYTPWSTVDAAGDLEVVVPLPHFSHGVAIYATPATHPTLIRSFRSAAFNGGTIESDPDGGIWTGSGPSSTISKFAADSSGSVEPVQSITGADLATQQIAVGGSYIYAYESGSNQSLLVFGVHQHGPSRPRAQVAINGFPEGVWLAP
jgi:hypothetical protein